MKAALAILIALGSTLPTYGVGPEDSSPLCGQGVARNAEWGRDVRKLRQHLDTSAEFHAEAAAMAGRTLGRIAATNPDLREQILGTCASEECQQAYADAWRSSINIELARQLPPSEFTDSQLLAELDGNKTSSAIALIFHQKKAYQAATAKSLATLGPVARLAVADAHDSIQETLIPQLSRVVFSQTDFPEKLLSIRPEGESFDVHLYGGYFSQANLWALGEHFIPLLEEQKLKRLNFIFHASGCYLLGRSNSATFKTLYEVTDFDYLTPATHLTKRLGPFLSGPKVSQQPQTAYTWTRQDQKEIRVITVD